MKKILVFNRTFFSLSETFIQRQVAGLLQHARVELIAYTFEGDKVSEQYVRHQIYFAHGILDRVVTFLIRRALFIRQPFSVYSRGVLKRLFLRRDINMLHVHYGWNALAILSLAKKYQVPLSVSFHGKDASAEVKKKSYRDKLPELFEYAHAVIVSSPHMIGTLGLTPWMAKVHVIPYGINPFDFIPSGNSIPTESLSILHAGRLAPKKGVPDLIRVFALLSAKFPFVHLHILGDGKERRQCELLIEELALTDSVTLYGAQPQSKVKELMDQCDIFVLNSRIDDSGDMEGLPNTVLEAMSFEKPVVSTLHAGIPQAVQSGENGLLVSERNNGELAQALETLIIDGDLRRRLGKQARQTVLQKFTLEKMQDDLFRVLSK